MDKYVRMMLIKLSQKFKVTITTVLYYNDEKQKFTEAIKIRRVSKFNKKEIAKAECFGKRALVVLLSEWLNH